jgi:hypothetical protein
VHQNRTGTKIDTTKLAAELELAQIRCLRACEMVDGLVPQNGNDQVMTPDDLASKIVNHFKEQIAGRMLEPCAGKGAFVRALQKAGHNPIELEIDNGLDFFNFVDNVDWIITNPPWSKVREFARHAYELTHDIVLLIPLVHFMLKARIADMRAAGFMIREIVLVDTPPLPWPQSGFQLGAIHFQKGWKGDTRFTHL